MAEQFVDLSQLPDDLCGSEITSFGILPRLLVRPYPQTLDSHGTDQLSATIIDRKCPVGRRKCIVCEDRRRLYQLYLRCRRSASQNCSPMDALSCPPRIGAVFIVGSTLCSEGRRRPVASAQGAFTG